MSKYLYIPATIFAAITAFGFTQQPTNKVVIPVHQTAATSGLAMYANYCAPCHGIQGKGNGPVASALRTAPTDLTVLSRKNNGRFPNAHIAAVLEFGSRTAAHGNAEMPIWGPILGNMNRANSQERQLRISNLCRYLESIQAK